MVEVDDVDVRAETGLQPAAISQPEKTSGVARLHLNHAFERNSSVVAVASPMGHQEGGEARITNRPDVCAPVAEPG